MINNKESSPKLASLAGKLLSPSRKLGKCRKPSPLLKAVKSLSGSVLGQARFRPKPIVSLNGKTSLSRKRLVGVNHHSR